MTGRMDELQAVQPRYVTTIRGRVINIQGFVADDSQYVIVFRESKEPMLHEVLLGQDRAVTFSFIHVLGSDGSTYAKITFTGSHGAVVATTGSRQYCHNGDGTCVQSNVYMLSEETLTQCTTLSSIPGEHVAGWSDDGVAYFVFASDVPDTPDMFNLQLFRVSVLPTGDCLLDLIQEVSFGHPLCGVRSLEIIRSFDARTFLLVANRRCVSGNYPSGEGNILIKEWNPQTKTLVDSHSGRELPYTSSVVKITSVSHQFFICQRHSEPSTVNVPTLPLSAPVVSTIRIHNQAPINAVQAPNKDVFVTHVTSVGSVVVDWVSCSLNQNELPSNFSLTSYTGKRQDYSPSGLTSYENATRLVGKPLYVPNIPQAPSVYMYDPQVILPHHHFRQSVVSVPPPPQRLTLPPPPPPAQALPTQSLPSQQPPPQLPYKPSELAMAAAIPSGNRLAFDKQTMYEYQEQQPIWNQEPSEKSYRPPGPEPRLLVSQWSPPPMENGQHYGGPQAEFYRPPGPFYQPPPPRMGLPPSSFGPPGFSVPPPYPEMYPPGTDYGNQVATPFPRPSPYFPENAPNTFAYPPRPYDNTLPPPVGYTPRYPVNSPQMTSYDLRPEVSYEPTRLRHVALPPSLPAAHPFMPSNAWPAADTYGELQPAISFITAATSTSSPEYSTTTEEPPTINTINQTEPIMISEEPVIVPLAQKQAESEPTSAATETTTSVSDVTSSSESTNITSTSTTTPPPVDSTTSESTTVANDVQEHFREVEEIKHAVRLLPAESTEITTVHDKEAAESSETSEVTRNSQTTATTSVSMIEATSQDQRINDAVSDTEVSSTSTSTSTTTSPSQDNIFPAENTSTSTTTSENTSTDSSSTAKEATTTEPPSISPDVTTKFLITESVATSTESSDTTRVSGVTSTARR